MKASLRAKLASRRTRSEDVRSLVLEAQAAQTTPGTVDAVRVSDVEAFWSGLDGDTAQLVTCFTTAYKSLVAKIWQCQMQLLYSSVVAAAARGTKEEQDAYPLLDAVEFSSEGDGALYVKPTVVADRGGFFRLLTQTCPTIFQSLVSVPTHELIPVLSSALDRCLTWNSLQAVVATMAEQALLHAFWADRQARAIADIDALNVAAAEAPRVNVHPHAAKRRVRRRRLAASASVTPAGASGTTHADEPGSGDDEEPGSVHPASGAAVIGIAMAQQTPPREAHAPQPLESPSVQFPPAVVEAALPAPPSVPRLAVPSVKRKLHELVVSLDGDPLMDKPLAASDSDDDDDLSLTTSHVTVEEMLYQLAHEIEDVRGKQRALQDLDQTEAQLQQAYRQNEHLLGFVVDDCGVPSSREAIRPPADVYWAPMPEAHYADPTVGGVQFAPWDESANPHHPHRHHVAWQPLRAEYLQRVQRAWGWYPPYAALHPRPYPVTLLQHWPPAPHVAPVAPVATPSTTSPAATSLQQRMALWPRLSVTAPAWTPASAAATAAHPSSQ